VKKAFLPLSILCLIASFLLLPVVKAGNNKGIVHETKSSVLVKSETSEVSAGVAASILYDSLKLQNIGLSKEAMLYAYQGQKKLEASGRLGNSSVLTVIDFSQPSNKKRMYIIDVKNYKVLFNTYVAHGKNTGLQYAEKFSNTPESLQSSLGFYVTKSTYFGKHGRSLKLSGMEPSINDKAEARAVVVHGATYIGSHRLSAPYMGRSFGCPAVPQEVSNHVIDLIQDGTCMFIYHPSQNYLKQSTILKS
jgi:hypothetical protein